MKDEKSIRRRVYDALNVLVAAGLIIKKGKKVFSRNGHAEFTKPIDGAEDDALKEKRMHLKRLAQKFSAMKNLYERNSMRSKVVEIIPYPLSVIVLPSQSSYEVKMKRSGSRANASINIVGEFDIVSNDGILKQMGMHLKSNNLPQELKYLCGTL